MEELRKLMTVLSNKYPAISDLKLKAQKRMPPIAWEYLDQGTDNDEAAKLNVKDLEAIRFQPQFLKGELAPEIKSNLFGQDFNAPFGMAPIGLTSLMWPDAEKMLAATAKTSQIPYTLSTVAGETPEVISQEVGEYGWFQLYTPKEQDFAFEIIDRAKESGFKVLVITVDIPFPSRRQRTKRMGFTSPPKITADLIWQGVTHPTWTLATLRRGLPSLRTVESHSEYAHAKDITSFMSNRIGGNLDWDYVNRLRDYWKGPVVLKGILHEADAREAVNNGYDGIWVSNHGGRQFDGSVSSISALRKIVPIVDRKCSIIFDSGVRNGLDVLRALALGADYVMLGRAWIYGIAALGRQGGQHVFDILEAELINCMHQLGVRTIEEIKELKIYK